MNKNYLCKRDATNSLIQKPSHQIPNVAYNHVNQKKNPQIQKCNYTMLRVNSFKNLHAMCKNDSTNQTKIPIFKAINTRRNSINTQRMKTQYYHTTACEKYNQDRDIKMQIQKDEKAKLRSTCILNSQKKFKQSQKQVKQEQFKSCYNIINQKIGKKYSIPESQLNMVIQKIDTKIAFLDSKNCQLLRQNTELNNKLMNIQKMNKQIGKMEKQLQQIKLRQNITRNQLYSSKAQNSEKQLLIEKLKSENSTKEKQINCLVNEKQQKQHLINALNKDIQILQQRMFQTKKNLQIILFQQKKNEDAQLKQLKTKLQQERNCFQQLIEKNKAQIQIQNSQIARRDTIIKELTNSNIQLTGYTQKQRKQFEKKKQQIELLKNMKEKADNQIIQLEQANQKLNKEIQAIAKQKIISTRHSEQVQEQNLKLTQRLKQAQELNFKLTQRLKQSQDGNLRLRQKVNYIDLKKKSSFQTNFRSLILPLQLKEDIEYLINIIETMQGNVGKKVVKIQILYDYSVNSQKNFRQFIQEKQNLLVLAKSKKNHIFGGLTNGKIRTRKIYSDAQTRIFTITNRAYFEPNSIKNSLQYEKQNQFSFGNSQMMFQHNKNEVFSLFYKKVHHTFKYDKNPSQQLFGESLSSLKKTVQIESYEFHQIIFERQ